MKRLPTVLGLLLAVSALAVLALVPLSCNDEKKSYSNEALKKPVNDDNPRPEPKPGPKVIRPLPYTPPEDPESHRLDMLDFERKAYTTLRKFSVGQRAFIRDVKPLPIDLDGDKMGEYAYLLELMGVSFLRTPGGRGRAPLRASWPLFKAANAKEETLFDKKSPEGFNTRDGVEYFVDSGGVVYWTAHDGISERDGYYFMFFLPGKETVVNAGAAVPDGDASLADLRERRFAGVAWPKEAGVTGRRVFVVYEPENVWVRWNIGEKYNGRKSIPDVFAGLDKDGRNPRNLDAAVAHNKTQLKAMDGGTWKIFGERKGIKREFEWKWPKQTEMEDYINDGGPDRPWMKGEEKKKKKSGSGG